MCETRLCIVVITREYDLFDKQIEGRTLGVHLVLRISSGGRAGGDPDGVNLARSNSIRRDIYSSSSSHSAYCVYSPCTTIYFMLLCISSPHLGLPIFPIFRVLIATSHSVFLSACHNHYASGIDGGWAGVVICYHYAGQGPFSTVLFG